LNPSFHREKNKLINCPIIYSLIYLYHLIKLLITYIKKSEGIY
jgi:hypothetical protein